MNYKKTYDKLINNAIYKHRRRLDRSNSKYVYYEKHHIIPRCLGGDNSKDNLVLLTAREHFVAHKLLAEMYPEEKGLIHAIVMMCRCENKRVHQRNYIVSSREFARYKLLFIEDMRERIKGEGNPMYGKTGEENPFFGKKHKQETIDTIKYKLSIREIVTCPWCNEEMNSSNAQQYHFDNCLKNPNISKDQLEKRKIRGDKARNCCKIQLTCPHCNKTGSQQNMIRYHLDNCIQAPVMSESTRKRLEQNEETQNKREEKLRLEKESRIVKTYKCDYCDFETTDWTNYFKWHGDNCTNNPNCKRQIYTCYRCGATSTNKTNITRFHNDNCGKVIQWKSKISNQ